MSTTLTSDRANGVVTSPPTVARSNQTLVQRHPVLSYYALTFAISWGGILFVVGGPGGIPGTSSDIQRLMPLAIPFMLFGPTIAALVMIGVLDRRRGYQQVLWGLSRWRVDARWYAVALLTAPLVYAVVLLLLSRTSNVFLPGIITAQDKLTFLLVGTAPGSWSGSWRSWAGPDSRLQDCGSDIASLQPASAWV